MAKAKHPKTQPKCELPPLKAGSAVVIIRPHLWSGCAGVVESYDPATTFHRVLIAGRNGESFHADVTADCLKLDYAKMLEL